MNDRIAARRAPGFGFKTVWLVGSLALIITACGTDPEEQPTALGALSANPDFSTMVGALQKAGLVGLLEDPSRQLTVFAPNNAAFNQLFADLGIPNGLEGMSAAQLNPILRYHVLGAMLDRDATEDAAKANAKIDSLGGKIQLSADGDWIRLDGRATVIEDDVWLRNGVIHVLDRVILPSAKDIVTTDPNFSSLVNATTLADTATPSPGFAAMWDDETAALTTFAPNNAGFTALVNSLKGNDEGATTGINSLSSFRPDQMVPVIAYHVMTSRMLTRDIPTTLTSVDSLGGKLAVQRSDTIVAVDGIRVATTDIYASNGVIHVLDRVLLPSITDMVTTSAQFSALKNAVLAADFPASTRPKVAATLDGATPYTLFAPSNAAFTALGALPEGQALTNQLLYHAGLEGAPIYAATALGYTVPIQLDTALANRPLSVYAQGSDGAAIVKVGDSTATPASVIVVNYFAGNGVIHVIDRVLIPAP